MQWRHRSAAVSVVDAVDFLSDLAEGAAGKVEVKEFTLEQQRLKEVFGVLLHYMQALFSTQRLKDRSVGQGLQALMLLVREVVDRLERIQGKGAVTDLPPLQDLERFYQQKILPFVPKESLEIEQAEGGGRAKRDMLGEIAQIRKDRDYELCFLRKNDGSSYLLPSLRRHVELVAYFDRLFLQLSDDQPFEKLLVVSDRDCHEAAKQILASSTALIDAYYREALKFKHLGFVSSVNKALMALMLAANTRNLRQNTTGKSAWGYYQDVQLYLREAFTSTEYKKMLLGGIERAEHFLHTVLQLAVQLCSRFFLKIHTKKEGEALIHALIKEGTQGSVTKAASASPLALCDHLRDQDESLRVYFKHYPNGPLLKLAESLKTKRGEGFDPLAQGIFPGQLYVLRAGELDISILSLPSPTKQEKIDSVALSEEFLAWLQGMRAEERHHVLINIQDRTHWREHARASCLEQAPTLEKSLTVMTLDKSTDFYHQSGSFTEWDDATEFLKLCKEQLIQEQSGCYLPSVSKTVEGMAFIEEALGVIHRVFFGRKERLTHQNRQSFIDLFYLLLSLKEMELCHADSASFTSKDSVDTAAAMSAQLFAFIKFMTEGKTWSEESRDRLLWILHAPALLLRGRVIEEEEVRRLIGMLELVGGALDTDARQVVEAISQLFREPFFKKTKELLN